MENCPLNQKKISIDASNAPYRMNVYNNLSKKQKVSSTKEETAYSILIEKINFINNKLKENLLLAELNLKSKSLKICKKKFYTVKNLNFNLLVKKLARYCYFD